MKLHEMLDKLQSLQMVALEDQAAALMQKHARLAAENAALRRRHQALELSIAGREEHVNLLAQMSSLTIVSYTPLTPHTNKEEQRSSK